MPETPSARPQKIEGQDRRYLLGGTWLRRMDPTDAGIAQRLYAQRATDGWSTTTVPSAWNAGDDSAASFIGGVAWYRKDFRLPLRARTLAWIVRFESVNYRATVWLNGRRLGDAHGRLPAVRARPAGVDPRGVNRLVVRVDNRRIGGDPSGAPGDRPVPPGGWWNYGGLLREVSLRAVDRVDVEDVQVVPQLPCPRCAATVLPSASVRNVSHATQLVHLAAASARRRSTSARRRSPARERARSSRRLVVRHPKLWSPAHPNLYGVRLAARAAQGERERRRRPATRCAPASAR